MTGKCQPRCWFAYYGFVGSSSPVCLRCDRPNPRYNPAADLPEYMTKRRVIEAS